MPKTVEQIRQQIEKLRQQERELLAKEVSGVVARIREAVAHYQLTPEQIFGPLNATVSTTSKGRKGISKPATGATPAKPGSSRTKAPTVPKGTKLPAKYKDGAGNSWSGRGSQPRWLKAALASGAKLEDFAVAGN